MLMGTLAAVHQLIRTAVNFPSLGRATEFEPYGRRPPDAEGVLLLVETQQLPVAEGHRSITLDLHHWKRGHMRGPAGHDVAVQRQVRDHVPDAVSAVEGLEA